MRHLNLGYRPKQKVMRAISDLLEDQRKGKPLTLEEKKAIKEYAEEQRKKKLSQTKNKKKR